MILDKDWTDLLERFAALGGIAENVCQREGEYGRGIFPIDPLCSSKVMTPKNLLIKRENIGIYDGEIIIKDGSCFSVEEKTFLEFYYNNFSWGNNGNCDSFNFLKFISSISEPVKSTLFSYGFVDKDLLDFSGDEGHLLKRFIDERAVTFSGDSVIAPVWEFINHSSFSAPLRITPFGVETPPIDSGSGEVLFKYSGKNSPMSMWRKYGFACRCIVAYSIPFAININHEFHCIKCSGQQVLAPKENKSFALGIDSILIKSLPVGCLSRTLPFSHFNSILSSVGISVEVAKRLFPKVQEINIRARSDLLYSLQDTVLGSQTELYKALTYEIELIQSSTYG